MFNHLTLDIPKVIQCTDENGNRYYTREGSDFRYESVTTFLGRLWNKDFLVKWKKRIGETKALSESLWATGRGSHLHKTMEMYLLNNEVGYKQALNSSILGKSLFLKIKPEINKINNIRCLETSLYSDEMKLAGTPDVIADYNGVFSTVDLKGSGKEKLEEWITTYWLQTAIYSRMYSELFGEMPSQSVIIMAVEDCPAPSVFIESSYKGQQRLDEFLEDPIGFQENLNERKASSTTKRR